MARIINPARQPVILPTGHVVPRLGDMTTTNDVLRCPDNAGFLRGMIASGQIGIEYDPDPEPEAGAAVASIVPIPAEKPTRIADLPRIETTETTEPPATGKKKGA